MNAILGNGLRVGVLLHGKKIQDDNRTLLQSGISQSDDINTVGFMLEPNSPTQPSPPVGLSEHPTSLPCDSPKFAIRYSTISVFALLLLFHMDDYWN